MMGIWQGLTQPAQKSISDVIFIIIDAYITGDG